MSVKARAYAAERGWSDEADTVPKMDGIPRTADGEIDWITRLARVLPTNEGAALAKGHAGITDWNKLTRLRQAVRRLDDRTPVFLTERSVPAAAGGDQQPAAMFSYSTLEDWNRASASA